MKLVNRTRISDNVLREIVKFLTKGISQKIRGVTFSYTRQLTSRGRFEFSPRTIRVAIARQESEMYPILKNARRHPMFNFPQYVVNDEEENAFSVLAHEVAHARAYFKNRKSTNRQAEVFAYKKLQEWRRRVRRVPSE
jgi:hypothetical protein